MYNAIETAQQLHLTGSISWLPIIITATTTAAATTATAAAADIIIIVITIIIIIFLPEVYIIPQVSDINNQC